MRSFFAVVAVVALAALAGCQHNTRYAVAPVHHEVLHEKLDAEWFVRDISDEQGLHHVELVYCPVQPGESLPVCRTSIVWSRGQSALATP